jgi:hypothetical protein
MRAPRGFQNRPVKLYQWPTGLALFMGKGTAAIPLPDTLVYSVRAKSM